MLLPESPPNACASSFADGCPVPRKVDNFLMFVGEGAAAFCSIACSQCCQLHVCFLVLVPGMAPGCALQLGTALPCLPEPLASEYPEVWPDCSHPWQPQSSLALFTLPYKKKPWFCTVPLMTFAALVWSFMTLEQCFASSAPCREPWAAQEHGTRRWNSAAVCLPSRLAASCSGCTAGVTCGAVRLAGGPWCDAAGRRRRSD